MGGCCAKQIKLQKLPNQYKNKMLYELNARDIDGSKIDYYVYRKRSAFIIVNVACKPTKLSKKYFRLLNDLNQKYRSKGLEILAFPCGQFAKLTKRQEYNSQIKDKIVSKYAPTFQLFSRVDVNGKQTCPTYAFLRNKSELFNRQMNKSWQIPGDYSIFLLNGNGRVVKYYEPMKDKRVMAQIEEEVQKLVKL